MNEARSGEGRCTYPDTTMYDGQWDADAPNGNGTLSYLNGDLYEGIFKDGKRGCGLGKMEYCNGDIYEGQWDGEVRRGEGRLHTKRVKDTLTGQ